jgi:hypothetical protein
MRLVKRASQQKMAATSTKREQKLQPDATLHEWKTGSKGRSTRSSIEPEPLGGKQARIRLCKTVKQAVTIIGLGYRMARVRIESRTEGMAWQVRKIAYQ